MNRRNHAVIWSIPVLAAAALCATAQAQTNAPAQSSQPATAATSPNSSPVTASNAVAPPAPPASPTKKIWTNEDLGNLRSGSSISTFQKKSESQDAAALKSPPDKGRNANWYRAQITKLQAQIPQLDAKIAQLQAAIAGHSVNNPKTSSRPYGGVKPGDWKMQMNQYQQSREDLLAKISALQDEARHAGVSENDIP